MYRGNEVKFVSNITDIDDKLIKRAGEEGVSMQEVARKYEEMCIRDRLYALALCLALSDGQGTASPRAQLVLSLIHI